MRERELFDAAGPETDAGDLEQLLERLEEISPGARDNAICALLSALVPRETVRRFAEKVLAAGEQAGAKTEAGRAAAENAANDRLDPDTEKVLSAAYKTAREFDRLRGLLRFKPEPAPDSTEHRRYTARCAPDHFVLPLLADHFSARFGQTPWAVIDEKRRLVLSGGGKKPAKITPCTGPPPPDDAENNPARYAEFDRWETLWRTFHHAVNNESRNNADLQKQFLPVRYRKYVTEFF
ncbi:MAG: TIGR03915 family putative DNA repair protein [Treponema sp.]|jgi:probable DNA metabolism protein|nr:TIGR03915 family putative DNA repair protein [Treponema sp.]